MQALRWLAAMGVPGLLAALCTPGSPAGTDACSVLPARLRCEYRENPLGIDAARPRLGWICEARNGALRGLRQTAYEVQVASSAELLARDHADLWDSGKVAPGESGQVEYAGKPLVSNQQCHWRVRLWDAAGNLSEWSKPASWTMGLLDPKDWNARWVTASPGPGLPLFRRAFEVRKPVRRAMLYVCGLGQHEVRMNGEKVGDDLLEPGWTDYRKTCLYTVYDVTDRLRQGPNAVGVMLGNGMYNVKGGRYTKFTGSFGEPKLIAELRVDYADGTRAVLATDGDWKTTPGPITFSCTYGGEDYDARREQPGWDSPGFDDSSWHRVAVTDGPGGRLVGSSQSAPPIRATGVFKPIEQRQIRPGEWVYDLGQNCSMLPRLSVRGRAGSRVTVRTGERFEGNGFAAACSDMATYNYVLRGGGTETWSPRFTYVGCRYLLVQGAVPTGEAGDPELPVVESIEGLFVCGSAAAAGEFACSSDLFNRTAELIRWAMRSNMMSVLTDCPHREKLGWLEQDHLVGPSLMYSYDLPVLYTKIAGDIADAQLPSGLVPDIAPEYVVFQGGFRDSPEWGSACVLIPWQVYECYGGVAILRARYDTMRRYVDYLGTTATGFIVSHGLADWYAITGTAAEQTATAFYYVDAATVAKVAALLGERPDAARYAKLAADVRTAYNTRFFDETARQYAGGTQAANAMPVAMGIAEPRNAAAVVDAIVRDVRARGNALTAGDVGYRYVLRALAEHRRSDVIFDMNSGSDKPGYGMMLARGATSLTEAWNADPTGSSLNHFMLGHIMEWFYADLAGIQAGAPGYAAVAIRPQPVGDLTWVRAHYDSVRGRIVSNWTRDGDRLFMEVTIPANVAATVYVPAKDPGSVAEGGRPTARARSVRFLRMDANAAVYEIGSGTYRFTTTMP